MLTVLRRYQRKYWTSELRLTTGRSCIRHLLQAFRFRGVVCPAYAPEGIINPCLKAKLPIDFYGLNPDLTPNLDSLKQVVRKDYLVFVIHYFGYPTPLCRVRDIVHEAQGYLLEDCAHTLYDDVSKAQYGDLALWSLNKFMPVTDGAILRSRCQELDVGGVPVPRGGWQKSDAAAYYRAHLHCNTMLAEATDTTMLAESEEAYEKYYELIDFDYTPYTQTEQSKLIEQDFDIEVEKAVRSTNAWRLSMILPTLRNNGLPQFALPVMCKSAGHREEVSYKLAKLGVLACTQIAKWNHIWGPGFENETDFINRHLLLPLGDPIDMNLIGQIKECVMFNYPDTRSN